MASQLTHSQLEHIELKTNERGAAFEHPYTFVEAHVESGDNVLHITAHVADPGLMVEGWDRITKGFWKSFPEGQPVDIPEVNSSIQDTLDNVEKKIRQAI